MAGRISSRTGRRAAVPAALVPAIVLNVALIGGLSGFNRSEHGWLFPAAAAQTRGSAGDVADVVERVKSSVVGVSARVMLKPDDEGRLSQAWGQLFGEPKGKSDVPRRPRVGNNQGSGFFISSDGYVVTTNHLVEHGEKIEITTHEDRTYSARLIGSDPKTDLALLKVDADEVFPSVPLAAETPRIGEQIIAVGNPYGLGGTVTAGIVSAHARDIKLGTANDFIQIDAPVNQGNSGGPTFDLRGNVIGVNSAIFSPTGGSVGIGFAIPAETVRDVVAKLKERGAVVRGWMGVQIQPLTRELAEGFGVKEARGAVVIEPQSDSPAVRAGIASGDIITAVNGEAVKDDRDLVKRIGDLPPGMSVSLEIVRKGDRKTIAATLAEMPGGRNAAPSFLQTQRSRPDPSKLGFELTPASKLGGVIVTDLDPGGLAAENGLQEGDIILEIESKIMKAPADVRAVLTAAREQGKRVAIARVKTGDSMRFVAIPVG
jgi:serine protease Do